ncbi:MAG TPA: amidohydrolase family protein [Ilumatobacteraceae bacterium]|nr:amidohydrolase family protein [Ilumatobacteraceae bacterium]
MSVPQQCDLLICGATILDLQSASGVLEDHAVAISADRIVAVGPTSSVRAAWTPTRMIDATGMMLSPGFVDAHVHLSANLGAGRPYQPASGPGLFSGASRIVEIGDTMAKLMAIPVPDDVMRTVARTAFVAMVRSGITSVVDAGSSAHRGLIAAANDVGIRAAIGPTLGDTALGSDGSLSQRSDPAELIAGAREFLVEHHRPRALVKAMVSAADTISCSDELLAQIGVLSGEFGSPTHVHSHISPASNRAHLDAYGERETDRLLRAGMLSEHCTLMHVGALDDGDIEAFAATGVTVNHNPLGNAMLGFGTAHHRTLRSLLDAHIPVVMGSDYTPSMCATPFDMIRAALAVHREVAAADNAITLEEALQMATNPANSVGRVGEVGRVAVGQLADLVVVDVTGAHHTGNRHPIPNLALRARTSDIATVIINGTIVIDNHELGHLDEASIINEANQALSHIAGR